MLPYRSASERTEKMAACRPECGEAASSEARFAADANGALRGMRQCASSFLSSLVMVERASSI